MTRQRYRITGMHCQSCVNKVRIALSPFAPQVQVTLQPPEVQLIGTATALSLSQLNLALQQAGQYQLMPNQEEISSADNGDLALSPTKLNRGEALLAGLSKFDDDFIGALSNDAASANPTKARQQSTSAKASDGDTRSWLATYRPLLIVFGYIVLTTSLSQLNQATWSWMLWMQHFMAMFFLVFSFFKMLDIASFANSYAMYDLLAMRVKSYGYVYPFIELGLGLAYLTGWQMHAVNWLTLVVMGFSSLGVIRSVLNKQKIRCACLGAVFNLPMSFITIVEDLLMVAMAAAMLIWI